MNEMIPIKKKRGRPRKISADTPLEPLPPKPEPIEDKIFPKYALLVNPLTHGTYRMRCVQRTDIIGMGRTLHRTLESMVNEAHLFKGVEIRFQDDKPAEKRPTVTVTIDGQTVVDRGLVSTFSGEDPQFNVKDGDGRMCLFLAAVDSGAAEADINAPRIGYFLPDGSTIMAHVDSDREVAIRLVLGRYSS